MTIRTLNERALNQIRPVWRGDEQTEQFADVSDTVAQILTIPTECTGITVVSRDPVNSTALFILPTGSTAAGPRIILDGGSSARRRHYMAVDLANPPPVHLLAEVIAGADADVFYHFD